MRYRADAVTLSPFMGFDSIEPYLAYDGKGALKFPQTLSTLPRGYKGKNLTAEVVVHPSGHFLFMGIGTLAGFAVLVEEGANLGVVGHQMARLVDSVGHLLTPQLRDDLRRMNTPVTEGAGSDR